MAMEIAILKYNKNRYNPSSPSKVFGLVGWVSDFYWSGISISKDLKNLFSDKKDLMLIDAMSTRLSNLIKEENLSHTRDFWNEVRIDMVHSVILTESFVVEDVIYNKNFQKYLDDFCQSLINNSC